MLTADELSIVHGLQSGQASYESGLALYASVTARQPLFPQEWEILILRATLAALPERDDLAARLRQLELAPPVAVAERKFETSLGPIYLTTQEEAMLDQIRAARASAGEALTLYTAITARGQPFPPEWEELVLRATIREMPERDDLISRLAWLSETTAPDDGLDATTRERVAFERNVARFSQCTDLNHPDASVRRSARAHAFEAAASMLACAIFSVLPTQRRSDVIAAIHDTMMSAPSDDLFVLAELGVRRFAELLDAPDLTLAAACRAYDGLHSLAFAGTSNVQDLGRFDRIARPLEDWLRRHHASAAARPMPAPGKPLTIAYLLHTAHFDRGNAVSPLVVSLAEGHGKRADRRILLYATQFVREGFVDAMAARGVTVRSFPQDHRYDRIEDIARSLSEDDVDVVITEQNRAVATALFAWRVAPLQIWLDTGFPFWNLETLDWTLSPAASRGADRPVRTSPIVWGQASDTLGQAADPESIAQLRSTFPEGSFVLGVFVRLVKLDAAYLDVLRRILLTDRQFHLVIAGPGDPDEIEAFVADPALAGRVTFHAGLVDLDVYGSAIDVMCDTFPFIGGNACRQVSARGTPVIARLGTPWDPMLEAERNPDLLARDNEGFIALAIRMKDDDGFRAHQRNVTRERAKASADPEPMVNDVEDAISEARARCA